MVNKLKTGDFLINKNNEVYVILEVFGDELYVANIFTERTFLLDRNDIQNSILRFETATEIKNFLVKIEFNNYKIYKDLVAVMI